MSTQHRTSATPGLAQYRATAIVQRLTGKRVEDQTPTRHDGRQTPTKQTEREGGGT